MKYIIVKETKPTLKTFGKYKAKAVHNGEVGSRHIRDEVSERLGISEGAVEAVMMCLSNVISHHLRRGDKVDDPTTFRANKHIRGVRLHFLPESEKGKPELYQDMTFEKERG